MATWYRARFDRIEPVEVKRATAKFVVYENGTREAIDSEYQWIRAERDQAKLAMIAAAEQIVKQKRNSLEYALEKLRKCQEA